MNAIEYMAKLQWLDDAEPQTKLTQDIEQVTEIYTWIFHLKPDFLEYLMDFGAAHTTWNIVADHRQRATLSALMVKRPNIEAYTWSKNRTMHQKIFVFPQIHTTWLMTHNVLKGSFKQARNSAVRIDNTPLAMRLREAWARDANAALKIPHSRNPEPQTL